jgi:hypothetical protein
MSHLCSEWILVLLAFPLVHAEPLACAAQAGSSLCSYKYLGCCLQHACQACLIKSHSAPTERRSITRSNYPEYKNRLEAVQRRLDRDPGAICQ